MYTFENKTVFLYNFQRYFVCLLWTSMQARQLAAVLEMSPCCYPKTNFGRNMWPVSREHRKITSESMLSAELTYCIPRLPLVYGRRGGLMFVRWTPDRAVRVRALAAALRCILGQDTTLIVPLFAQLAARFIMVPAHLLLGVALTLRWTNIPSRRAVEILLPYLLE